MRLKSRSKNFQVGVVSNILKGRGGGTLGVQGDKRGVVFIGSKKEDAQKMSRA